MRDDERTWDGVERRQDHDWLQYKRKIISDIEDTKEDIDEIKKEIGGIKILMTEMKMEIKQIVSRSSAVTSSFVSIFLNIIGGVIIYYLTTK